MQRFITCGAFWFLLSKHETLTGGQGGGTSAGYPVLVAITVDCLAYFLHEPPTNHRERKTT